MSCCGLQPAGGVSQISFGGEESASPKKPVTIPEVAKQKELSGTQQTTDDIHARRGQFSNAKAKELVGSNIFGPPPPDAPKNNRSFEMREESKSSDQPQPRNLHTSVKISNVSFIAFICLFEMYHLPLELSLRVPGVVGQYVSLLIKD